MIRLLTILVLLVSAAAARAEPPVCRGSDLLAKFAANDPAAAAAVQKEAAATPNGEALLWRVTGRGGVADSHLFGTAHLTDPRILDMPGAALAALDGADVVALELKEIGSTPLMALEMARNARFMAMPPGQSLWALIPDREEALILGDPNYDRSRHLVFDAYQPWVVAAALSLPACERRRQEAQMPVLDAMIARRAIANGSELVGLETVAEQIGVLAGMPMQLQVQYLVSMAGIGGLVDDIPETTIVLYQQRKVTSLLPLLKRLSPPEDKASAAAMGYFESEVIEKRNLTMRDRALKLLARGNAFIAVGALHLPGRTGLVAQLRAAGFEVTAVE